MMITGSECWQENEEWELDLTKVSFFQVKSGQLGDHWVGKMGNRGVKQVTGQLRCH